MITLIPLEFSRLDKGQTRPYMWDEIIHIDPKNRHIYLDFHDGIYKSDNKGLSFRKIAIGNDFTTIATQGEKVMFGWAEDYCEGGHDDYNYFMKSLDSGTTFKHQFIGRNGNGSVSVVKFHWGVFYAEGGNGLFKSLDDKNEHFDEIPSTSAEWQEVLDDHKKDFEAVSQKLAISTFPDQSPIRNDYNHIRRNRLDIRYVNDNFNQRDPTPGIVYSYEKNRIEYLTKADDVPRIGAYDRATDTVYFASHTGVWKWQN